MSREMKPSEVVLLIVAVPVGFVLMGRGLEFALGWWGGRVGWSSPRQHLAAALAREAQLGLTFIVGAYLTGFSPVTLGAVWLVVALAWIPMEVRHARLGLNASTGELFGAVHMTILVGLLVASDIAAKLAAAGRTL